MSIGLKRNGKGSWRRPYDVKKFGEEHERIFGPRKPAKKRDERRRFTGLKPELKNSIKEQECQTPQDG